MASIDSLLKLFTNFTDLPIRVTESTECINQLPPGRRCGVVKGPYGFSYLLFTKTLRYQLIAGPFLQDDGILPRDTGKEKNGALPSLSPQREEECISLMEALFENCAPPAQPKADTFFDIVEANVAMRRTNQLPAYDYLSVKHQIRQAILDKPSQVLFDFLQHTFEYNIPGTISGDQLRTRRILSFTFLSAIVKTAIETGLEVFRAFIINDLYLKMIDGAESIEEMDKLLFKAICHLSSELKLKAPQRHNKYVQYCLSYISNNLSRPIKLRDIALELGLTSEHLSRTFSSAVGKPFGEYLMDYRMSEARRMLIFSKESCSAIAYLTGFSSSSHFSRAFIKCWKISPRNLRMAENMASK